MKIFDEINRLRELARISQEGDLEIVQNLTSTIVSENADIEDRVARVAHVKKSMDEDLDRALARVEVALEQSRVTSALK